ncbi:LL-diaminopimelate aminotransferase [Mucisphaera calidilacus]|uniref:LL-diaminopimelate aminotransferase n=1 Tax=Mucisphaera calidilacus TaxID=2527982 RepID=A0A518BXF3_9BACT|nr:LL-diaminopimelate aminotransferase [Mucisphaera calidilacus]QDU71638.1 LL-diaminopimelate aminotransferase [Mucisphaera calidilacus]
MARVNENFLKLQSGFLFPEIARRVEAYTQEHAGAVADKPIIKMGLGDVTQPLPAACVEAMHKAVDEQASADSFHGYAQHVGYDWLREAIAEHDFRSRGCDIAFDEVFISDGAKSDCANILDLLASGGVNRMAITDPAYPVYVDTNVIAGNTGAGLEGGGYEGLLYLAMTPDNGFDPPKPTEPVDVVYLCYPNNPTGAAIGKEALQAWVDWARERDVLLFFDAAYEAFITDPAVPHSVFECDGAAECAIEMRSYSKSAAFTGTRCGYCVIPKALTAKTAADDRVQLNPLWLRRQRTKFNSVCYIVQRAAEALYSDAGKAQVRERAAYYLENARLLGAAIRAAGLSVHGGENAPYLWVGTPDGMDSWGFFDHLLREAHVVVTPGAGMGPAGEGFVRVSAFPSREDVERVVERVGPLL